MKAVLRKRIAAHLAILVPAVLAIATPTVLWAATNSETPPISESQSLSAAIDSQIEAAWTAAGVVPAAPASDGEFLRRVYLDLVGAIPPVGIVRQFLEDPSPNKRAALVDQLLASPRFTQHFSQVLRSRLTPESTKDNQTRYLSQALDRWLRLRVSQNVGYDQLMRELISASVKDLSMQNIYQRIDSPETGPSVFFFLKESKPEALAASTARTMLGVRIECAQCHDHPFEHWKRDQFWSYAAFFGGLEVMQQNENQFMARPREVQDRRELAIPGTERVVQARFLDGNEPEWKAHIGARVTLAEWITSPENPYFSRAMANRTWAQFFGTGLVDPVDDMGPHNPASHPALLDELAAQFASHGFDVKYLMRSIVLSRPYQLASALSHPTQSDRRQFARMVPRGLTPDQLLFSVEQTAGGGTRNFVNENNFGFQRQFGDLDEKFAITEEETPRYETSIIQALELLNGRLTNQPNLMGQMGRGYARQFQQSSVQMVTALAQSPFMSTRERIETMFLATLTRMPSEAELDRLTKYVNNPPWVSAGNSLLSAFSEAIGQSSPEARQSSPLTDVYWALLNSPEFLLNH